MNLLQFKLKAIDNHKHLAQHATFITHNS